MSYKGDFAPGAVLDWKFNTRDADGAPITIAGTPSLTAYKDNGDTQDTSGLTLSVDFDSVTGLHNVRVDTSADGTFYSAGSSFSVVLAAGTVDSVSVVGVVVGEFTLARGAAFARLGAPAGASVSADIAAVKAETALIVADTNELQTDWVDGGRLDLLIDAIKASTDNLPADPADASDIAAAIAALNDISEAEVNAQVLDVLNVDTFGEPTGVPAATSTLSVKLGFLFMALRNRVDVTATKKTFYDDSDAAEWEKDLSDDGTTYSESEGNAL